MNTEKEVMLEKMQNYMAEELEKLEKILISAELKHNIEMTEFPIVVKITGIDYGQKQLTLIEDADAERKQQNNGFIEFVFADQLQIQVVDGFYISDDHLNKIKNTLKKIHYLHLQIFFAQRVYSYD